MKFQTTRMSNRMFSLLSKAVKKGGFTLPEMLEFSMTTAGPLCKGGYLRWNEGVERFVPTGLGNDTVAAFTQTDVTRKNTHRPLAEYIRTKVLDKRVREINEGRAA